jgi:hypothetical protein
MHYAYKTVVVLGLLLALIAIPTALAQTAEKGPTPPAISVTPAATGVNHALKDTYIATCLPDCGIFALTDTLTPLDAATTITCPAATGKTCTITDEVWIETENTSTTTNNPVFLEFYVDGTAVEGFFDGGGGTPGGPLYDSEGFKITLATIGKGTHTIQTEAASEYGANGAAWLVTYRVYVP